MIADPSVDIDYTYLESLGKGSQASVDLYRSKKSLENSSSQVSPINAIIPRAEGKKYAVKKYRIGKDKSAIERDLILNEIKFLRDLRLCDNIVNLEAVYSVWDPEK